jgi:hypothetical protein
VALLQVRVPDPDGPLRWFELSTSVQSEYEALSAWNGGTLSLVEELAEALPLDVTLGASAVPWVSCEQALSAKAAATRQTGRAS